MSVQVAVRVRPFNQREIDLNCPLCVEMQGASTKLVHPTDSKKNKEFTFDYSFWSHSEFNTNEEGLYVPAGDKYADQYKVYDMVGKQILDNAWLGYHCCLFAYGQTGAGKSYSMVGYKPNIGIVPIACKEIFKRIESNASDKVKYEVYCSMLEIYNEKVQDLLIPVAKRPQGGLKIRENKTIGFYVEQLTQIPVQNYEEIEYEMDEGSKNRTIASTQMNANSSRAHTIITIDFKQIEELDNGQKVQKYSQINLVDLAGSEKVGKTDVRGDRLKEAGQINKSLHMLGMVISTLADIELGKTNLKVPYRDSCLTKILCNALGGNSKTLMICAISPSSDNFEETLSTLRYADQAKKIKNKAMINESATDKMIRELQEENDRFKQLLQKSGIDMTTMDFNKIQEQLMSNVMLIQNQEKSYQQKVEEAKSITFEVNKVDFTKPYMKNMNEDPLLNGKVSYSVSDEYTYVGRKNGNPVPQIIINGIGIQDNHAIFHYVENKLFLKPANKQCIEFLYVNGDQVKEEMEVKHNDRITFGKTTTFLLQIPGGEPRGIEIPSEITWEFVQNELTKKETQEKKELELKIEKEHEIQMEKRKVELEEKYKKQEEERLTQIEQQKQQYDKTIEDIKQKMENEKIQQMKAFEAQKVFQENMMKIEAEKNRRELEKEREKKKMQDDEIKKKKKIKEKYLLEEQLKKAMPKIAEVNYLAKEFKKNISFQIKMSYQYKESQYTNNQDESDKKVKLYIQVTNNDEGYQYLWDYKKFIARYYLIKEQSERYFETNEIPVVNKADDPFWDPPDFQLVGQGFLKLLSLGLLMDSPVDLNLVGDNGQCGTLNLNIYPTDEKGEKNISENVDEQGEIIEDPRDLLGKRLDFIVQIKSAKLPQHICSDSYIEYEIFTDSKCTIKEVFKTEQISGKNQFPVYNYQKHHTFLEVSNEIINYLSTYNLCFKVYAHQESQSKNIMTQIHQIQGKQSSISPQKLTQQKEDLPKIILNQELNHIQISNQVDNKEKVEENKNGQQNLIQLKKINSPTNSGQVNSNVFTINAVETKDIQQPQNINSLEANLNSQPQQQNNQKSPSNQIINNSPNLLKNTSTDESKNNTKSPNYHQQNQVMHTNNQQPHPQHKPSQTGQSQQSKQQQQQQQQQQQPQVQYQRQNLHQSPQSTAKDLRYNEKALKRSESLRPDGRNQEQIQEQQKQLQKQYQNKNKSKDEDNGCIIF